MRVESWEMWVNRINGSSVDSIDSEILAVENDSLTPYVEKQMKLGYLYYSKDYLGTAAKVFQSLIQRINSEHHNFQFIEENKKGLNILNMSFRIVPDGCGGFDIFESDCCGEACCPVCGCIGIAAILAVCKISTSEITTCDTTDGQGCFDNCCNSCDGCCDSLCGDGKCCLN